MRASTLILVLAFAPGSRLAAQATPPGAQASAEQAVRGLVEQFTREFRAANDARATAALFRPDAELLNLAQGWSRRGRADLERLWTSGFERHRNFPRDVQIHSIRFVAPDVALVDGSLERGAGRDPSGDLVPPWREHFTMVLTEQDGHWLIAAARAGGWNPVRRP